ncbi:methionyl-tRNA formyltransferase [Fructobacillus tropaeoli]|uniref:Methionyl-tRNA formyltransferase n=1 Tax=Fructobacillus tropaeoli TaxID=709323 RepID=A0A3F3GYY8_9LACO|nr:methionyl-tRNA formyltransferase [Fructobacillus tropaeoli]GAP03736.1 methionyl-tRNA formyltransferase [Fructobacillus tropaeoli]GIC70073.1 methionyl-tRNA formyltransferase [Fructobacillus tropaeoli]CAK1229156.1 Methionyl-tRNA formyltransferase (Fmt) [Fructobacillus tropaeoli]CAK1230465.1 Methionyl-tRNA formyltransferase (Fmt) [Fructobacillus tropaeoli]
MTNRVVFMGTPQFAVPILEALVADPQYDVLAVVTQPDRPQGRKQKLTPSPVKEAALAHDLPVLQPEKISGSAEMAELIDLAPDFIVTAAFGQFLPEKLLQSAKVAAVNAHASLLPKYRGGAPVHYAIMNGDQETGVSLMYMVKKMDAGDVIDVVKVPIEATDNVGTMFDKLSAVAAPLVLANLPKLAAGIAQVEPQDPDLVSFSPNISRDQQNLDFAKETAEQLNWHIRGLYPTHPAHAVVGGERFKLVETTPLAEKTEAKPGVITKKDKKHLVIAAADGTQLAIQSLQPAGKSVMAVAAYLNGAGQKYTVGDQWVTIEEVNA